MHLDRGLQNDKIINKRQMIVIICLFFVNPNRRVGFCTVGEWAIPHPGSPKSASALLRLKLRHFKFGKRVDHGEK